MSTCRKCGRKGFFLHVGSDGLCRTCHENAVIADSLLNRAKETAAIINSTVTPSIFFSSYADITNFFEQLVSLEPFVSFRGRLPSDILLELKSEKFWNSSVCAMLDRCIKAGRWKTLDHATRELSPYWSSISEEGRHKLTVFCSSVSLHSPSSDPAPSESAPDKSSRMAYSDANDRQIDRFCKTFDLTSIQGIRSITLQNVEPWIKSAPGVPSHPVEILSKQASAYKKDHLDLAIECLRKANEIRPVSGMLYPEYSYLRLVRYLYQAERFEEGDQEAKKIHEMFHGPHALLPTPHALREQALRRAISSAADLGTDLVIVSPDTVCCHICGKYRGRVFSLSGKDSRFPKFPKDFCVDCGLSVFPFLYGISQPYSGTYADLLKTAKLPLTDTRSSSEKEAYQQRLAAKKESEASEQSYMERERKDHMDYAWIRQNLPSLLPKTFSGYRRMKTMNTTNFQKLQSQALALGHKI